MNNNAWHPTTDFLKSINVHELLPQQEPFVMIDRLIGFDEKITITETNINESRLFVDNGHFTAAGLIENIAQTCAARIGYVNKYVLLKGIQIGFIGAIRGLKIIETPCVGSTITTKVEVLEDVFGMTLANAEIVCNGNPIVTTQIKIAIEKGESQS